MSRRARDQAIESQVNPPYHACVQALRSAIDAGDLDAVRRLLDDRPGIVTELLDAPGIEATSPLTYVGLARFYGYLDHDRTGEVATLLTEAGADADDETRNGAPLICAASHGETAVVKALLAAGAHVDLTDNPPDTALRLAAAFGWPDIVDTLIAAGARPSSVVEAAGAGDLSAYDLTALTDFQRACALRAAAVNDRLNVIDALLAAGTPIDALVDGHSAIHWARGQQRHAAVNHLRKHGAVAQD